jgi:hypothetical protein
LADAIKNNGAILLVNLLKNSIGVDQAKGLVSILKEHPTLKSLCGNKGNETELDMSGKMGSAEDAIMFAAEVVDNGALSFLDISSNNIGQIVLIDGITHEEGESGEMLYWDKDDNSLGAEPPPGCGPIGTIAIANAIPGMGALIKLDINDNRIGAEQEEGLQRICVASGIKLVT